MKKLVASMIAATALTLCLAGATNASGIAGSTIQVGSDMTYPPYNYFDTDKKPAGFDSEFMQLLADAGGFKINFVDTRFENLIIGVSGNKFDVVCWFPRRTEPVRRIISIEN